MSYFCENHIAFIIKDLKDKKKNSIINPVFKKTILFEKQPIRLLEMKMPMYEIIDSLCEIEFFYNKTKKNKFILEIRQLSYQEHFLYNQYTLHDKLMYYRVIRSLLNYCYLYEKENKIFDK